MMMALGQFVFALTTLAYQELQRQTEWRHPSTSRIGARPVRQFLGAGDDSVTLSGLVALELTGGTVALDDLRTMADAGKAWPLVDGAGRVYGQFVVSSLGETRSLFMQDGAARRIEFQLKLDRVDNDRIDTQAAGAAASTDAGAGSWDW